MNANSKKRVEMVIQDNKSNKLISHDDPIAQRQAERKKELKKVQLYIEGMSCASCVAKIENQVNKLDGVHSTAVTLLSKKGVVEFDETKITNVEIAKQVEKLGFDVEVKEIFDNYQYAELQITGKKSQTIDVEKTLTELPGVIAAKLSPNSNRCTVQYEPNQTGLRFIVEQLKINGIEPTLVQTSYRQKSVDYTIAVKKWRNSFLVAFIFGLPVMIIMITFMILGKKHEIMIVPGLSLENLLLFLLCTPVQFVSGKQFYILSWKAMKNKTTNMSVLIAMATSIAYVYSISILLVAMANNATTSPRTFFETPPMLITFIALGKWLENLAMRKTGDAIHELLSMQPADATLIEEDNNNNVISENVISVELVQVNDLLKVLPGATIRIIKRHLVMKASRVGSGTTLSRIIQMIEDAESSKAPMQMLADQIASYFVPGILVLSSLTLLVWIIIGYSNTDLFIGDTFRGHNVNGSRSEAVFQFSFLCSISVLAIACPCALGLATPTAIKVGTGLGAKFGILIKGGKPLEIAHRIRTVVFDKTGTLTHGKPKVVMVSASEQVRRGISSEKLLIALAGSAESNSEHPIGQAIYAYAKEIFNREILGQCSDFIVAPGFGLKCRVSNIEQFIDPGSKSKADDNYEILIGNRRWMAENNININSAIDNQLISQEILGRTAVIVAMNSMVIGIIAIADTVKDDAKIAVNKLREMGLKVVMLTGDNIRTAKAIAEETIVFDFTCKQVNIVDVYAEVLPEQKIEHVKEIQEDSNEAVAMVGDGINDSPALTQADVGIAIGSGTEVAIEAADIVLVKDNLLDVVAAIQLSRATISRIRYNFFYAIIYNMIGIPIAAGFLQPLGVILQPWMASAAMAASSVSVVASSLWLKRFSRQIKATRGLADRSSDRYSARETKQSGNVKLNSLSIHDGKEIVEVVITTV
ncbi:Copper-transporting ATPase 1 [Trichoplax sp. H2]|nr:Copper-transporting ATPase 1 [Trichoplax sp. H2]|eukprot:RDD36414.1 Copper-transporting ATPase 1 [Trichoplax sp. H2]